MNDEYKEDEDNDDDYEEDEDNDQYQEDEDNDEYREDEDYDYEEENCSGGSRLFQLAGVDCSWISFSLTYQISTRFLNWIAVFCYSSL